MKTVFIYSGEFARFNYGEGHPLKPYRLKLTYELIKACGLLAPSDPRLVKPQPASIEDLLSYHTREYINTLREANNGTLSTAGGTFGLGSGDNPVFPGMFDWSKLVAGASLTAAKLVESNDVEIAFNISGGLHHAHASRASGFCYINDPVLAIQSLVSKGKKVAYIDIDAHHGDGVQEAFYSTDKVLTISLHETGLALFPGSGFEHETGSAIGRGYSVNIPLPPEADDEIFVYAFMQVVPSLLDAFRPDIVVSQLGVDTFRSDPLTHLNLTTNGFCEMVRGIKALAPRVVALGGGGYNIANAARAWTLAWAIMNDTDAPDEIPETFLQQYRSVGFLSNKMNDEQFIIGGHKKGKMKTEVDRTIDYIKKHILK